VASEPIAVNSRLGRFTNMTNLLDLAAIAVPAGSRSDGLPFGVQLLGPAFSDELLLDVGSAWLGEPVPDRAPAPGTVLLAVAGAHLSGQPLNPQLLERGATLARTTTMAPGYRMYEVPGPLPRPGVTRLAGDLVDDAALSGHLLEVEVWNMPVEHLGSFLAGIAAPLAIGPVELADGSQVLGFLCSADGVDPAREITGYGGWRGYLAARS
jgi:allophanate hydrolase